jgi:predicted Zn-dependent peptidase
MKTKKRGKPSMRQTKKNIKHSVPEEHIINGYHIFLYPYPNKSTYVEMVTNNGFISETKQTSGINHLLEHVLTNAWNKCKDNKCSPYWTTRGVEYNASTSDTLLRYYTFGVKKYTKEMLDYIVNITVRPKITWTMIENEHTAVENELLREANKRDAPLYDTFHKHFFVLDGLRYAYDWKQQIDNLKTIKKDTILNTFHEYYHQNNTVFMVSGDFNKQHVLDTFSKYLKTIKPAKCGGNSFTSKTCYAWKKDIIYVADPSNKTTQLLFGFPTNIHMLHELYDSLDIGTQIIKNLLFERLRTQLKLVYGISVNAIVNSCGAYINIEVFVNTSSALKVVKEMIKLLKKYKKQLVPTNHFHSVKTKAKLISRNLSITPQTLAQQFLDQYATQIQEPKKNINTFADTLAKINAVTRSEIKELYNECFNSDYLFLAYQSNKKLPITSKLLTIN